MSLALVYKVLTHLLEDIQFTHSDSVTIKQLNLTSSWLKPQFPQYLSGKYSVNSKFKLPIKAASYLLKISSLLPQDGIRVQREDYTASLHQSRGLCAAWLACGSLLDSAEMPITIPGHHE